MLSGCTTSAPLLKHQPIDVQQLVYVPVPDALTQPIELPPLPPARSNGELLAERDALREALRQANEDRARVARLQGRVVDGR